MTDPKRDWKQNLRGWLTFAALFILFWSIIYLIELTERYNQSKIYSAYDQDKLTEYCRSQDPTISSAFAAADFHYRDNGSWTELYINKAVILNEPNHRSIEALLEPLLRYVAFCKVRGKLDLKDLQTGETLATASLAEEMKLNYKLYWPEIDRPQKRPEVTPSKPAAAYNCKQEAIKTEWLLSRILLRQENDWSSIYVLNKTWYEMEIFFKRDIVEYVGRCKAKNSYTYFYDSYTGKKLARYLPLWGVTTFED